MKISILVSAALLLLCTATHSKRQHITHAVVDPLIEIKKSNEQFEQAVLNRNADSVVSFYAENLTFFPEYKPALFDNKRLRAFYNDWFRVVNISAYKKKTVKVEAISNYLLEIGTFRISYSFVPDSMREYTGKYMMLWKRDGQGRLRIVSETFGSDKYISAEQVPYAGVEVEETSLVSKNEVPEAVYAEVEAFNARVIKAVEEGNGNERAAGFTKDGIYMPHFDTTLVGIEAIKPYMLKTYKPGGGLFVKHTFNRVYDLGDYIFVNGHFKGSWRNAARAGTFEGNMSNLMKRQKNGLLLMHRQIGNNDRKDTALN
jgi:ketosteroid isomerase-like protein